MKKRRRVEPWPTGFRTKRERKRYACWLASLLVKQCVDDGAVANSVITGKFSEEQQIAIEVELQELAAELRRRGRSSVGSQESPEAVLNNLRVPEED